MSNRVVIHNNFISMVNSVMGTTALPDEKEKQNILKADELRGIIVQSQSKNFNINPDKNLNEKLSTIWMYENNYAPIPPPVPNNRSVMLIPASAELPSRMLLSSVQPLPFPTPQVTPMTAYHHLPMPYYRTTSMPAIYASTTHIPSSMPGTFRTYRSSKSTAVCGKQKVGQSIRIAHKSETNRKQRRKSDADILDGSSAAFKYTGLDRALANNYLAQQERSNTANQTNDKSKTKIICEDANI